MNVPNLSKKIEATLHTLTTYHAGIVQNKTYRLLKQRTAKILAPAKITTAEWALLGMLQENASGVRLARAANELGVEPPFVTALVRTLSKKGYLITQPDDEDSRAKKLCLTSSGKAFVKKMEPQVRKFMRPAVAGISVRDLITYFKVMQKINANLEGEVR